MNDRKYIIQKTLLKLQNKNKRILREKEDYWIAGSSGLSREYLNYFMKKYKMARAKKSYQINEDGPVTWLKEELNKILKKEKLEAIL